MKKIVYIFGTCLLLLGCNKDIEDLEFFDKNGKKEAVKIMIFKERSNTYTVNETTKEITYNYVQGTDIQSLTPSIEVSSGATIFPPSGEPQDFTSGVDYVVTSADKSVTTKYRVLVRLIQNNEADILEFKEDSNIYVIDKERGEIRFVYPHGTDISSLNPTIGLSAGATIVPPSGKAQDFTNWVEYEVTSEDKKVKKKYKVIVSLGKNSQSKILDFKEGSNAYVVDESKGDISFTYPYGTDVSGLTPSLSLSMGATSIPASGEAQDFTNAVEYVVTSADKSTTTKYKVIVRVRENNEAKILSFKQEENTYTVNEFAKKIRFVYPYGTDVSSLTPSLELSSGATVVPASDKVQDFTNSVEYVVTSADKSTTTKYDVIVSVGKNKEAKILEFTESSNAYVVDESKREIRFTYPYGTDVSSLTPSLTLSSGASVVPASDEEQDFTNSVEYVVTSADKGTTTKYNVIASVEKNNEAKILSFKQGESTYTVNEFAKEITYNYSYGTDISSLTPSLELSSGASVVPASGEVQNFTSPVNYVVTAENGRKQTYRVVVKQGDFLEKDRKGTITLKDLSVPVGGRIFFQGREYAVVDESILRRLIADEEFEKLPYVVTSKVTNMSRLFDKKTTFNEDISSWDVSNVIDMNSMFLGVTSFNRDLSNWNVSNVTNMALMFYGASSFNGDISKWNVSKVYSMRWMFHGATNFNRDLSGWNVSNVTNMEKMFASAESFQGGISNWNVENVFNMKSMFHRAKRFDSDLSNWNISRVRNMSSMFLGANSFNGNLSSWDVSNVTNMEKMFYMASSFNQDLSRWQPRAVTNVSYMFSNAVSFDQDISNWCANRVLLQSRTIDFIAGSKIAGTTKAPNWSRACR